MARMSTNLSGRSTVNRTRLWRELCKRPPKGQLPAAGRELSGSEDRDTKGFFPLVSLFISLKSGTLY